MASEEGVKEHELYEQRRATAEKWRTAGLNPFGNGYRPANTAREILDAHEGHTPEQLDEAKKSYSIAGRVVALRSFGKAAFIHVADRTGAIQVHVKKDALGDVFEHFKLVDLGDFVGLEGVAFRSKTGELTLSATTFKPLSKALRPLPSKFANTTDEERKAWVEKQQMQDVEQRYRQRYLDMLSNPDVRDTFVKRTKLVQFIRRFLDERGYLEVETPMMHSLISGAAARPFVTHHNALDMQLFMRIAPELYLKRLVVGGFDRVYEINRNFRNEGISTRHNPEFTMLEFYEAYATYEDLMDLTETMVAEASQYVAGNTRLPYGELTIDFKAPWPRIPMLEAIRAEVKELSDKDLSDDDKLRALASKGADEAQKRYLSQANRGEVIGALFEAHVEAKLIQPTFITQFPVEVSPLARRNDADPSVTDRFELFVAGREIANAFSELNDPIDQESRFRAQVEAKARGHQEAMDFDADYIRALEHGLPPTAGEGIGIDRLAMLFTDAPSIRDVILFPLLKSHK